MTDRPAPSDQPKPSDRPTPEGRPAPGLKRLLDPRNFRQNYGAGPLHLIVLVASFALAGYAAVSLVKSMPILVIVWFIGAAVVHDIVLLPLYGLADRVVAARLPARDRADAADANAVNYVRVPAGISLLLLLIYLPTIARLSGSYTDLTALTSAGYFVRWLIVTGVLFALSGLLFVVRVGRGLRAKQGG